MKYAREIKAGVVATICLFLMFFGFNFLKGVNIFTPTNSYLGYFVDIKGLEMQSPVYIHGYKVGQVDEIVYDFNKDTAFCVSISINDDIQLPEGTVLSLVSDGLLGGSALELQLGDEDKKMPSGGVLSTTCVPGLMDVLQQDLLAHIDQAVMNVDSLVRLTAKQLEGDELKETLANLNAISSDLTVVSKELKIVMANKLPIMVENADSVIANLNVITADVKQSNLQQVISQMDTAVENINTIIMDMHSQKGTVGKLLYDSTLYNQLNATVVSADSLLTDIKKHPKRYINISVFGRKEK
jgi:phospholipid/cholesterol/gamma-HCH transport system substrate-binding protein